MTSKTPAPEDAKKVTPARCLVGASISAGLGTAAYYMTAAIGHSFYSKPLTAHSQIALRIGSLVRTLVMGIASLGTFIFAFVTVGLILLAIQLLFTKEEKIS
ncbi:DUF3082 domain-containing protein [Pannus brasiliensis CCIBt3594]|uniref:DUF3082 domain-containing protein n=1 Tax=Pannus brasiliensis CCIBt3594 TaxID=1427578 RepID=A0AAW9QZL2_9CHRO